MSTQLETYINGIRNDLEGLARETKGITVLEATRDIMSKVDFPGMDAGRDAYHRDMTLEAIKRLGLDAHDDKTVAKYLEDTTIQKHP
ncbi:MAG: hypothetical protein ABIH82_03095 [Candidatus Woesearchaeota archaeon]